MKLYSGFTLLELLVAASVTAGLAVILTTTLSSILSTYSERNRVSSYIAATQTTANKINSLVSAALFVKVVTLNQNPLDSALVLLQHQLGATQEYDLVCVNQSTHNLELFQANVVTGGVEVSVFPGVASFNTCSSSGVNSIPTVGLLFKSNDLFDSATTTINHFAAWPIWSETTTGLDYTTNPPAVRYQIIGSPYTQNARASLSINQYPSVYQTTILTAGATENKKVGP